MMVKKPTGHTKVTFDEEQANKGMAAFNLKQLLGE